MFVMLHSGSRSLGKTICDEYHKRALAQNRAWHTQLPHDELAFLPVGTDDYAGYWSAMEFALRFAEVNRSRMLDVVEAAFGRHTKIGRFERVVDIHHNYAAWEHHVGVNGIVHRKGAVRARAGEIVLIPGSMGTASYVGEGLGNAESFETCQHGAGRALSRSAARKAKTSDVVYAEMADLGVVLRSSEPKGVAEEAAFAYKDIESVMAASASLVRPTKRLTPLGCGQGLRLRLSQNGEDRFAGPPRHAVCDLSCQSGSATKSTIAATASSGVSCSVSMMRSVGDRGDIGLHASVVGAQERRVPRDAPRRVGLGPPDRFAVSDTQGDEPRSDGRGERVQVRSSLGMGEERAFDHDVADAFGQEGVGQRRGGAASDRPSPLVALRHAGRVVVHVVEQVQVDHRRRGATSGEVAGIRTRDGALATGDRAVDHDQHAAILAVLTTKPRGPNAA